jgi:hypothetical protein
LKDAAQTDAPLLIGMQQPLTQSASTMHVSWHVAAPVPSFTQ